MTSPPKPTIPNLINIATKPRWAWNMLKTPRRQFRNIVGHVKNVQKLSDLTAWANEQFDPKLDWGKVARIRDQWKGKFILKGVLDAEDAKIEAVTQEQVKAAAQKYLKPNALVIAVVKPEKP